VPSKRLRNPSSAGAGAGGGSRKSPKRRVRAIPVNIELGEPILENNAGPATKAFFMQ